MDGETSVVNDFLHDFPPLGVEATEDYLPSSSDPSSKTTPIYQQNELEYRKYVNEFVQITTEKASKQIIETDKLMLSSQVRFLVKVCASIC